MTKNLYVTIFTLFSLALPGTIHSQEKDYGLLFGYINDNLYCSYEAAVDGWSWGPDDQFSFGFLARYRRGNALLALDYTGMTRAEGFRADICQCSAAFTFPLGDCLRFLGGFGIGVLGDLGGQELQNRSHTTIGYSLYDLSYLPYQAFALIRYGLSFQILTIGFLEMEGYGGVRIYVPELLSNAEASVAALCRWDRFTAEAVCGYKAYFEPVERLETVMKSGFYLSANASFRFSLAYGICFGFGLFPVGNVRTDPNFIVQDFTFIPQVWIGMTLGSSYISSRDHFLP